MTQPTHQQNHTGRLAYEKYLTTLSPKKQKRVAKIANAIGCIFTADGQVNGSALLIHKNLILVPKHCFPFKKGKIYFKGLDRFIMASTLLDGENDPPADLRSDFKLLYVADQKLKPAPLTLESSNGNGVQFSYHIDGTFYALFYKTPKTASIHVKNSDAAQGITLNGDAGGARYSWNCKSVTSLSQGERGVLTINQVFHIVESILSSKKIESVKRKAAFIMNSLQEALVDKMILDVDAKAFCLQPNQVISSRYGLFQIQELERNNIPFIFDRTKMKINRYLQSLSNTPYKRDGFFSKMLGINSTIHQIMDKDKKVATVALGESLIGASNVMIKIGSQAVATLEVEDKVVKWAVNMPDRVAALVQYIVHQFWVSLRTDQPNLAYVKRISLRE